MMDVQIISSVFLKTFFLKFSFYLIILFSSLPFIAYGTDCVFLEGWQPHTPVQSPWGQICFRIQKLSSFVKFTVCALTPLAVSEGAFIGKHIHFEEENLTSHTKYTVNSFPSIQVQLLLLACCKLWKKPSVFRAVDFGFADRRRGVGMDRCSDEWG